MHGTNMKILGIYFTQILICIEVVVLWFVNIIMTDSPKGLKGEYIYGLQRC